MTQVALDKTAAPFHLDTTSDVAPPPPKTVKMELKRNYVPHNLIAVVGYQKPDIVAKNVIGQQVVVEKGGWIDGEMKPGLYAGVGYANKVWAGTVIEVPEAEAKTMRAAGIAEAYL